MGTAAAVRFRGLCATLSPALHVMQAKADAWRAKLGDAADGAPAACVGGASCFVCVAVQRIGAWWKKGGARKVEVGRWTSLKRK